MLAGLPFAPADSAPQPALPSSQDINQPCPDYATIAYDASTGTQLWVSRYDGPGHNIDRPHSIGMSPDGARVFVTGDSVGLNTGPDYATIAYDAFTGKQLWLSRYDGPLPVSGEDDAASLGVTPNGSEVLVTGGSDGVNRLADYATIAYDSETGTQLWVSRFHGPGGGADRGVSIVVALDGTLAYVTGRSEGQLNTSFATIAYDPSTGATVWVSLFSGPVSGDNEVSAVGTSPDGRMVLVTGSSQFAPGVDDYATVAYDAATGKQIWGQRYDGPGHDHDGASSLAFSPEGNRVFVTGGSFGMGSSYDYATIAYSAR